MIEQIIIYAIVVLIVLMIFLLFPVFKKGKNEKKKGIRFYLTTDKKKRFSFNPFENFLIYGGAGSGKTKSIGKPLLEEYIKNGFAGLIYDYKEMDYTKTAYHLVKKYNYPYKVYNINFADLDYSDRTNPINPKILERDSFLQIIGDIYDSTAPKESHQDYFFTSGKGLFRGISLYFYDKKPKYCTIPHIAQFICTAGRNQIYGLIEELGGEYRTLASSYCDNFGTEAFSNILSTVTNNLSLLAQNHKINYVLSENEFDFKLIGNYPKLVTICNSMQIEGILEGVISALFSVSSRAFTMDNETNFFYLMDEATTFKISDFERKPSVLREYKCSFTYLTQSASKIEKLFGKLDRASIEANFANAFYGRTKDVEALKVYPLAFGKKNVKKVSRTRGSSRGADSRSSTVSEIKEEIYDTREFTELKAGQFICNVSSEKSHFKCRFKMYDDSPEDKSKDLVYKKIVSSHILEEAYKKTQEEVNKIIDEARVIADTWFLKLAELNKIQSQNMSAEYQHKKR